MDMQQIMGLPYDPSFLEKSVVAEESSSAETVST